MKYSGATEDLRQASKSVGSGFDLCNINSFVPLRRQVPSSTGSIWPLLDLYTENRRIEASSIHEV
jgi:hypothetical protein